MADTDLISLYSKRILELAGDASHVQRLRAPDVTIRQRAPRCGSSLIADVSFRDGRIKDLGLEAKACALGQAAASAIARHAVGQDEAAIIQMRDALLKMLQEEGVRPAAPFEELEVLIPARDYPNRHGSIMLLANALVEAFEQSKLDASLEPS